MKRDFKSLTEFDGFLRKFKRLEQFQGFLKDFLIILATTHIGEEISILNSGKLNKRHLGTFVLSEICIIKNNKTF